MVQKFEVNHKLNAALFVAKSLADVASDVIHIIISFNIGHLVLVVLQHGRGLVVELLQAGAQLLLGVIAALDERLAGDIVFACHLGRAEEQVVGAATGGVNQATGDSLDKQLVVDVQVDHLVDADVLLLQKAVQNLSLVDGSGKPIKDETLGALRALNSLGHNTGNHIITNKLTSVHDRLGLQAHLSASLDGLSEHVAGGQVAQAVLILNSRSLGSLSSTRRTEEDGTPTIQIQNVC